MDLKRVYSILDNKEKCDIFYDDRPVWIQGVNENIAKVGFIDNFEEKDVFIDDLYERNLYNKKSIETTVVKLSRVFFKMLLLVV